VLGVSGWWEWGCDFDVAGWDEKNPSFSGVVQIEVVLGDRV